MRQPWNMVNIFCIAPKNSTFPASGISVCGGRHAECDVGWVEGTKQAVSAKQYDKRTQCVHECDRRSSQEI